MIELSDLELSQAQNIWKMRCEKHKAHKKNTSKKFMESYGVDGFAAELAVVKYLGITDHEPNFTNNKTPDVGEYDVRQTRYEHGKLLLYPNDPDDRITIFVVGSGRKFELKGWIKNSDGKQKKYWGTLRIKSYPAFIIPQIVLNPMHTLPKNT